MTLTTQEQLFLKRVALKMVATPALSVAGAMRAVCEDDRRIFEQFIIMPDRAQAELVTGWSASVYHQIRATRGTK